MLREYAYRIFYLRYILGRMILCEYEYDTNMILYEMKYEFIHKRIENIDDKLSLHWTSANIVHNRRTLVKNKMNPNISFNVDKVDIERNFIKVSVNRIFWSCFMKKE